MKYIIDIDGTICSIHLNNDGSADYTQSKPFTDRIEHFNKLYDEGHEIHYWTARGSASGIDRTELTHQQMNEWGVKYTSLQLKKPSYDVWIDDKAINANEYFYEEDCSKWNI